MWYSNTTRRGITVVVVLFVVIVVDVVVVRAVLTYPPPYDIPCGGIPRIPQLPRARRGNSDVVFHYHGVVIQYHAVV